MKAKLIKRKIIASTISEAVKQLKEIYPCSRLITTRVKDDDRLRKNKERKGDKMLWTNNFKKCLQMFKTYRFYKKYDYCPLDKLRMFLSDDWEIDTEINMRRVIFIRNKLSNVNTIIIKNTLLFTDMDYVSALCKNLIQRHERSYFSPFQNYESADSPYNKDLEVSALPTPKESPKAIPSLIKKIYRGKKEAQLK